MEVVVIAVLLTMLAIITVVIVRQRSLFGVVILSGIYSFLMASVLIALDAVDVAMTEASVGAGISTVLFLATLYLTSSREYPVPRPAAIPLLTALGIAAVLVAGTLELPPFGTADAPIHKRAAPRYLEKSIEETTVPNVVTSVLADYRGYDTLGETAVIFTAGIGVLLLLRGRRRRNPSQTGEGSTGNEA